MPSLDWSQIWEWITKSQVIAAIATFGSLILALGQSYAARKHTKSLERIQESLTTRYVGDLKSYFPEVIELIETAREEITILCDYPAYGCVTNSKSWNIYSSTLLRMQGEGKVKAHLTCPEDSVRRQIDRDEYFHIKTPQDWANWKTEKKNREQLAGFLTATREKPENFNSSNAEACIDSLTREGFLDLLQRADGWMLHNCFDPEHQYFIPSKPHMDIWIVDGMTAIFALTNYKEGMSRYGFRTTDQKLIDALRKTIERYR